MNILVTGANGFVGKYLVGSLIKKYNVAIITTTPETAYRNFGTGVQIISYDNGSFNESDTVKMRQTKFDAVVHLASYLTASDEKREVKKLLDTNIFFLVDLLDSIKENPPRLFVNTGSSAEYLDNNQRLNPAYFYAATKTASRSFLDYYSGAYKFKYMNMILYTVYGRNDSNKKLIDYLLDSINEPKDFTDGEQRLDFVHVKDVVSAYEKIVENIDLISNGESFFVGTGRNISIRDLAELIQKLTSKKLNANWGAISYRKRDVMNAQADLHLNNKAIRWQPKISLKEGLKELIKEKL